LRHGPLPARHASCHDPRVTKNGVVADPLLPSEFIRWAGGIASCWDPGLRKVSHFQLGPFVLFPSLPQSAPYRRASPPSLARRVDVERGQSPSPAKLLAASPGKKAQAQVPRTKRTRSRCRPLPRRHWKPGRALFPVFVFPSGRYPRPAPSRPLCSRNDFPAGTQASRAPSRFSLIGWLTTRRRWSGSGSWPRFARSGIGSSPKVRLLRVSRLG